MTRTLLVRGMFVGFAAALLALLFGKLFGEPLIDHAIAFETARALAEGETARPDMVSRTVQSTIGLATGVAVYSVAFGGMFALVFAILNGRLVHSRPRVTSALLALTAFVVIELVPFLKYPANPPAIGNPATLAHRTQLYFAMIGLSVIALVAAAQLTRRLVGRHSAWNGALVGLAVYAAAVAIAVLLMPALNEVPPGFPAAVLWQFRVASLGTHAVLWTTIGLTFGALTERAMREPARPPLEDTSNRQTA